MRRRNHHPVRLPSTTATPAPMRRTRPTYWSNISCASSGVSLPSIIRSISAAALNRSTAKMMTAATTSAVSTNRPMSRSRRDGVKLTVR
jgi:hypothetical protein